MAEQVEMLLLLPPKWSFVILPVVVQKLEQVPSANDKDVVPVGVAAVVALVPAAAVAEQVLVGEVVEEEVAMDREGPGCWQSC